MENKQCIQCGKESPGDVWQPGQVCVFGMIFACSMKCAIQWGNEDPAIRDDHRPGQRWWDAVEPAKS